MSKSLIIVESPNKIKTIQSYVGDDYEVIATVGHFRELNRKRGYTTEFDPIWEIVDANTKKTKKTIIDEIKTKAKTADKIYLATDPDREGEAISWHVWDILPEKQKTKCKRITFNEVTKKAILKSIEDSHEIDMNLVYSQFTRRILDRIIGYRLSTYAKKALGAISAGRVQSIALLFVVERELERRAFVPTFWWEITANLSDDIKINFIDYFEKYTPYANQRLTPFRFGTEAEAKSVFDSLSKQFKLENILDPKITTGDKLRPITTDKLLQLGSNYLGWNTSKTTLIAQKMFEGIEYNDSLVGLISYPRTDSERFNDDFILDCKKYILDNYGQEYYEEVNVVSKTTKANANVKIQDAHEAIRPVYINITPEDLKKDPKVDNDVYKLYNVIWSYTLSCLMKQPVYENTVYMFDNNNHKFTYNNRKIIFKGYKILPLYDSNDNTPSLNLKIGDIVSTDLIDLSKHEKQPPPYYTEATLISALKEAGVGRPSTYSAMARIGETRGYINKEKQKLIPNEIGMNLIALLTTHFKNVINKPFTANMELDLDKIALGEEEWKKPIYTFVQQFDKELKDAYENTKKLEPELVGRLCPKCSKDLVYKMSKFHKKFIACSGYPDCDFAQSLVEPQKLDRKCPDCGSDLLIKQNKKGQDFVGCSNYPNCKHVESYSNNTKK